MLHNIDTVIAKIERRGLKAPLEGKPFSQLIKFMHEIRLNNLKELKSLQTYTEFVYAIACNVPNSTTEEGQINKTIYRTDTKHCKRKGEKGYFYLENLSLEKSGCFVGKDVNTSITSASSNPNHHHQHTNSNISDRQK